MEQIINYRLKIYRTSSRNPVEVLNFDNLEETIKTCEAYLYNFEYTGYKISIEPFKTTQYQSSDYKPGGIVRFENKLWIIININNIMEELKIMGILDSNKGETKSIKLDETVPLTWEQIKGTGLKK